MWGKRQSVLGHVEKDDILTFIFYSQSVMWWYKPEHNNTKTLEKDCLHVLWPANLYNTLRGGLHKGHHSSHLHKAWLTTGGKQERKPHRICEVSISDVLFPGTYCSLATAPYSLFLFFSGINISLSAVDRTMSGGGGISPLIGFAITGHEEREWHGHRHGQGCRHGHRSKVLAISTMSHKNQQTIVSTFLA